MKLVNKNPHFLLMAAGCVVMLVAVFAFTTLTSGGSWGVYLFLLLLCPAMHFLMHRGLHDSDKRQQTPHAHLTAPERKASVEEQTK
jgi:hypothetical protein